ncbi:hypothetical protein NC981_02790 [Leptolyngbya sp. DQ-M1]|uniref:hypothetical protein n=1 Tax=Leptolyngbya sp. DQ-M1 TaxID=2933920 RepID=UPI003298A335
MFEFDHVTTDAAAWSILKAEFNPARLHAQETVFTIGNGYLGTRSTLKRLFQSIPRVIQNFRYR